MPHSPMVLRGYGDTAPVSNTTNAALLIGLGAAVIIGGIVFFGPKKMHANASRKRRRKAPARKRRAPARRSKSGGGGKAAKAYAYWAKITRRDLDAGYLTPSEIDESLRVQFDKDEGEYRRDGIKSASQFVKGVRAKL